MNRFPRALRAPSLATVFCLAAAAAYGWHDSHALAPTLDVLWIVVVLALLEVSLSFDNAVVNAAILTDLDPLWRRRFLTWGMAISVLGTRVAFPLAIVGLSAGLGPMEAVRLSLADPARYEALLRAAHPAIAGFGGAFLVTVGLGFFLDPGKDVHWLGWVERRLSTLGALRAARIALPLAALAALAQSLPVAQATSFLTAGLLGLIAYLLMASLCSWLENREAAKALARTASNAGLATFLYLNLLDASFSLDGVVGAFALSNNMVVIALGLTIGAIFVRSLTVMLVEHSTLARYRYLEHGAFWAITALGAIMLLSTRFAIPDAVTGLIGAGLIALALVSSMRAESRNS